MIRPLRQRHRIVISTLAVLLPLAFALGLSSRKAPPRMQETPTPLRESSAILPQVLFETEDLWPDFKIFTRLLADALPPTRLAVELQPQKNLSAPDILVYWTQQNSGEEAAPLTEAYLLGTLAGKQTRNWFLPEAALQSEGKLILYSLAHQTVLATASLKIPQGERVQ